MEPRGRERSGTTGPGSRLGTGVFLQVDRVQRLPGITPREFGGPACVQWGRGLWARGARLSQRSPCSPVPFVETASLLPNSEQGKGSWRAPAQGGTREVAIVVKVRKASGRGCPQKWPWREGPAGQAGDLGGSPSLALLLCEVGQVACPRWDSML